MLQTQTDFISARQLAEETVVGELIPAAVCMDLHELDTPSLSAMVVEYDRHRRVSGAWYSETVHYFDMSLTQRPRSSRVSFEGLPPERQVSGKVVVAPAGHRLYGESSEGRHRKLNLYVRALPLFPDEEDLRDNLQPMLRECISFKGDVIYATLERIAHETSEPTFASAVLVEGLGLTLLAETARALRLKLCQQGRKGGLPHWRLRLIEERVRTGERTPSIAELAQLCGLSRRHLTRAFREETGKTISSFVHQAMLERARTLLIATSQPIAEVALQVGFSDPRAFATAFRRSTGESPRSYRAARRF